VFKWPLEPTANNQQIYLYYQIGTKELLPSRPRSTGGYFSPCACSLVQYIRLGQNFFLLPPSVVDSAIGLQSVVQINTHSRSSQSFSSYSPSRVHSIQHGFFFITLSPFLASPFPSWKPQLLVFPKQTPRQISSQGS